MGNASYNIVMELNSSKTNEIYVTNINQYIAIDKVNIYNIYIKVIVILYIYNSNTAYIDYKYIYYY